MKTSGSCVNGKRCDRAWFRQEIAELGRCLTGLPAVRQDAFQNAIHGSGGQVEQEVIGADGSDHYRKAPEARSDQSAATVRPNRIKEPKGYIMQLDEVATTEAAQPAPAAPNTILCPQCGYSGYGFLLVELVPVFSVIVPQGDGLLARLDRSELRFDELHCEADRIECPSCRGKFPVPESLELRFAKRN
jgi:hypothetical protein